MTRSGQIGFSQRIQLEWLEYTANLVLAGNARDEIVAALNERLYEKLSPGNNPKRGNRHKAISILTNVWVAVPEEIRTLRDEGLEFLCRAPANERMLVHWCMSMAVYPFFGTVADTTGRLLRLQATVAARHVQRRLREQCGERETVARSTRRILRAFIDWGVLLETGEKGLYRAATQRIVDDPPLVVWAVKAMLTAMGDGPRSLQALIRGPRLFPFDIAPAAIWDPKTREDLEFDHFELDNELLLNLRKQLR